MNEKSTPLLRLIAPHAQPITSTRDMTRHALGIPSTTPAARDEGDDDATDDEEKEPEKAEPKKRRGYRDELAAKLRAAEKAVSEANGDDDELRRRRAVDAIKKEIDTYDRGFRAGQSSGRPDDAA